MKFTGTQKDEHNDPVFSAVMTLTGTNHIRFMISGLLFIKHQMQLPKQNKADFIHIILLHISGNFLTIHTI
jgi:hypothetical protein